MQYISISEYGFIGCDGISTAYDKFIGKRDLEEKLFQELYDFWLEDKQTQKIFTFENKKCLKATNYVGIIQTKNLSIEILPKIYEMQKEDEVRSIFVEMLKPLLGIHDVQISEADIMNTKTKNIYEVFILLFIKHMQNLIKKGLKSNYIAKEENQFFLKGKLKFNEHLKQNFVHKERFFVEFDEYLQDRAENRLLKSSLKLLLSKTKKYEHKKILRQQFFIFDNVSLSKNIDKDIAQINLYRGMEYYKIPIKLAKIFLRHESFSSLRGKTEVFALLFPMERVFEKYIEFVLNNSKQELGIKQVLANGGKDEYLLANDTCKMISLQPDYLLKMKEGRDIVTDAKWKLMQNDNDNKGCNGTQINSNDVYQIFSYLNFYNCQQTAYLFVPYTNEIKNSEFTYQTSQKQLDFKIKIIPLKLSEIVKNAHKINEKFWSCNNPDIKLI